MSESNNVSGIEALLTAIQENAKLLAGGLLFFVLAGSAVLLVQHNAKQAEISAFDAYYSLEKSLENVQTEMRKKSKDEKNFQLKFTSAEFDENFKDIARRMKDFAGKNAEYKAGHLAALDLAELLLQYGKSAEALEVLSSVNKGVDPASMVGGMYNLQLGKVLIENKKYDEAVQKLNLVTNQPSLKFLHGAAWLNVGLSHLAKGEKQQALDVFNRVTEEFSESEPGKAAKTYIRVMSMQG